MNLRNTPELTFIEDHSIAYGVDMARKIEDVIEHDEQAQMRRGEEEGLHDSED